jgi:hypothetical protein
MTFNKIYRGMQHERIKYQESINELSTKNKITVQNYKTQFEDVFKRIAAAVSKVEL